MHWNIAISGLLSHAQIEGMQKHSWIIIYYELIAHTIIYIDTAKISYAIKISIFIFQWSINDCLINSLQTLTGKYRQILILIFMHFSFCRHHFIDGKSTIALLLIWGEEPNNCSCTMFYSNISVSCMEGWYINQWRSQQFQLILFEKYKKKKVSRKGKNCYYNL